MNVPTVNGEQTTAIASIVVAVAILAGGLAAYQSNSEPNRRVEQLESDFRFQLEVAFRHNPNERVVRLKKLEQVTQAWQTSPQTTADREQLAAWLLESTIRSMPGSFRPLPEVPSFGPDIVQTVAQQPVAEVEERETVTAEIEPTFQIPEPSRPVPEAAAENVLSQAEVPEVAPVSQVSYQAQVEQNPVERIQQRARPVQINLRHLAQRIATFNDNLNEIEAELLALDTWDANTLTDRLHRLDDLAADYLFLELYYKALSTEERRQVVALRPITAVLAEIEQLISKGPGSATGDFLGEFDPAQHSRTEQLRRELQKVSARVAR